MKKDILWVEDMPLNIPTYFHDFTGKSYFDFLKQVSDPIKFCFDLDSAIEELENVSDYKLIISDGDFPKTLNGDLRKSIDGFLINPYETQVIYPDDYALSLNNFLNIHYRLKEGDKSKFVVFSASKNAAFLAYLKRIPFYFKNDSSPVESLQERNGVEPIDPSWEFGNAQDFFNRYIKKNVDL
jgi:hypothetical protein